MMEVEAPRAARTVRYLIGGGAAAGVAGGGVLLLLLTMLHPAGERSVALKIAAYPFLGVRVMAPGFDPTAVAMGMITHFMVSVIWGMLSAKISRSPSGARSTSCSCRSVAAATSTQPRPRRS